MKKSLITLAVLACAVTGFSQGQVQVLNFSGTTFKAGVYGVDVGGPLEHQQVNGQSAAGVPAGSTSYGNGALLSGTGFTAQLWYGTQGSTEDALRAAIQTTPTYFRTGAGAGFTLGGSATCTNVVDNPLNPTGVSPGSIASIQLRAWDNRNKTVNTWAAVLEDDTIPRGKSLIVNSPILTVAPNTPGIPLNLQSFNLFVPVPEPSLIALGALGLGALLLRRRKA